MAISIALVMVVGAVIAWWLAQQRLTARPWLEEGGIDQFPGTGALPVPAAKIGLFVFLAVAGSLFALFISAYSMRMEMGDWRPLPIPKLLWLNTGVLVLSSLALHRAQQAARQSRMDAIRAGMLVGGAAALVFLAGQLLAWRQLAATGQALAESPAVAFFYVLTAMHGLHILGGLIALGRAFGKLSDAADMKQLRLSIELCATYWHFLLLIWLVLFALLLLT